jgi:TM2 domain-containing membrane protein YozV
MRGQVLGVNLNTGEGQVAGDDGRRYTFRPDDWAHRGEPTVGAYIDFEVSENRALNIFPLPATAGAITAPASNAAVMAPPAPRPAARSKILAALLAFFFGTLGLHRFYAGRVGSGLAMLLLTCTMVGLVVSFPWAVIDTIRLLVMDERDFEERFARLKG